SDSVPADPRAQPHVTHPDSEARHPLLMRAVERLPRPARRALAWLLTPAGRWLRIPLGVFLVCGGLLAILPLFGLWMLPLGLILLAEDVAPLRRRINRWLDRLEQRGSQPRRNK